MVVSSVQLYRVTDAGTHVQAHNQSTNLLPYSAEDIRTRNFRIYIFGYSKVRFGNKYVISLACVYHEMCHNEPVVRWVALCLAQHWIFANMWHESILHSATQNFVPCNMHILFSLQSYDHCLRSTPLYASLLAYHALG